MPQDNAAAPVIPCVQVRPVSQRRGSLGGVLSAPVRFYWPTSSFWADQERRDQSAVNGPANKCLQRTALRAAAEPEPWTSAFWNLDRRLRVVLNLPTFDGHLVKGILAPMEVFHEPQGIQEV